MIIMVIIGKMAGDSPGYSLSLVAETTTGVLLSVERTAASRLPTGTVAAAGAPGWTGECFVVVSGGFSLYFMLFMSAYDVCGSVCVAVVVSFCTNTPLLSVYTFLQVGLDRHRAVQARVWLTYQKTWARREP